ncbi:unnamed protein product [Rotaria magnacalcarata]
MYYKNWYSIPVSAYPSQFQNTNGVRYDYGSIANDVTLVIAWDSNHICGLTKIFPVALTSDFFSLGSLGERLDNTLGGNANPTYGQIYGGAPGVGGYGGGYGYQYGGW